MQRLSRCSGLWMFRTVLGAALTDTTVRTCAQTSPGALAQVGLDVTHRVQITGAQLAALDGRGRFGGFLHQISRFYLQYHMCAALGSLAVLYPCRYAVRGARCAAVLNSGRLAVPGTSLGNHQLAWGFPSNQTFNCHLGLGRLHTSS